ncbi:hypothetical protein V8C86DRAFT_2577705 [Haematococcus lacustris]
MFMHWWASQHVSPSTPEAGLGAVEEWGCAGGACSLSFLQRRLACPLSFLYLTPLLSPRQHNTLFNIQPLAPARVSRVRRNVGARGCVRDGFEDTLHALQLFLQHCVVLILCHPVLPRLSHLASQLCSDGFSTGHFLHCRHVPFIHLLRLRLHPPHSHDELVAGHELNARVLAPLIPWGPHQGCAEGGGQLTHASNTTNQPAMLCSLFKCEKVQNKRG